MLSELARNPGSNPTATAIGVAFIAILLLLVIVSLLAWVLPGSSGPRSKQPVKRKAAPAPVAPPSKARVLAERLAATVLVVAAVGVFYGVTSTSSFCGTTCHGMAARNESWTKSSHTAVACVRCHEGVPVVSAVSALFTRSHSVYAQVTGQVAPGGSSVPASRCLGCHAAIEHGVVVSKTGLAMSHEQVIAQGSTCDDCHGQQGHTTKNTRPTMASCLRCHDGTKASAACVTCHRTVAQSIAGVITDTRFGKVRLANKPTCEGCHAQTSCDNCHGIRMPHPDNFADPKLHARPAAFSGKDKVCYRCHTFQDCEKCHQPFGSHVPDWEHAHQTYPRNTSWCAGCHKTPYFCSVCH